MEDASKRQSRALIGVLDVQSSGSRVDMQRTMRFSRDALLALASLVRAAALAALVIRLQTPGRLGLASGDAGRRGRCPTRDQTEGGWRRARRREAERQACLCSERTASPGKCEWEARQGDEQELGPGRVCVRVRVRACVCVCMCVRSERLDLRLSCSHFAVSRFSSGSAFPWLPSSP